MAPNVEDSPSKTTIVINDKTDDGTLEQQKIMRNGNVESTAEVLERQTVAADDNDNLQNIFQLESQRDKCIEELAETSTTQSSSVSVNDNNNLQNIFQLESQRDKCIEELAETSTTQSSSVSVNDNNGPQHISKLELVGIPSAVIKSLIEYGYSSVESVAFTPRNKLMAIKGINTTKVDEIQIAASKLIPMGFTTAVYVHQNRADIVRLTTGCRELDKILGGGIETGSLTEISGESSTGKTQLCHTLAVTCQLPLDSNGGEGKCLYIASEATFRPERLKRISERYNLSNSETLKNIVYARAYNSDHQLRLIQMASNLLAESRYALLIVDSVMAHYRTDYAGLSELYARQTHLGQCLRTLSQIADEFGVAVVITNQVSAQLDQNRSTISSDACSNRPVGGHVLAHACTTRLFLRRGPGGNKRICKLYVSPLLPDAEASFLISSDGIGDVKE